MPYKVNIQLCDRKLLNAMQYCAGCEATAKDWSTAMSEKWTLFIEWGLDVRMWLLCAVCADKFRKGQL